MASFEENKLFYDEVIKPGYFGIQTDPIFLLDKALEWIDSNNLSPERPLCGVSATEIEMVSLHCKPEEVYSIEELEAWAENNGFVEED